MTGREFCAGLGRNFSYAMPCVSLRGTEKADTTCRLTAAHGDIPPVTQQKTHSRPESSPDILGGSYRIAPQSPASSHSTPMRRTFAIIHHLTRPVKHFFPFFHGLPRLVPVRLLCYTGEYRIHYIIRSVFTMANTTPSWRPMDGQLPITGAGLPLTAAFCPAAPFPAGSWC